MNESIEGATSPGYTCTILDENNVPITTGLDFDWIAEASTPTDIGTILWTKLDVVATASGFTSDWTLTDLATLTAGLYLIEFTGTNTGDPDDVIKKQIQWLIMPQVGADPPPPVDYPSPCQSWITEADMISCPIWSMAVVGDPDTPMISDDLKLLAMAWATNELYEATGSKIGVCPATVDICAPIGCWCSPCVCGPRGLLRIPDQRTIQSIQSITNTFTDVAVDPARYAIIDGRDIAIIDRTSCLWSTEWSGAALRIAYTAGEPPSVTARQMAATLACEWASDKVGQKCRLSTKDIAIKKVRGREVALYGIPEVDRWLLRQQRGSSGMRSPSSPRGYSIVTS